VLAPRQEVVERRLLQRGADPAAHLRALGRDVEAGHRGAPGRRWQQRGEHVDRRRLAGSVGAEEAVDLTALHVKLDAVDRADGTLELPDEAFRRDAVVGHGAVD
jgi:hypothetical protein